MNGRAVFEVPVKEGKHGVGYHRTPWIKEGCVRCTVQGEEERLGPVIGKQRLAGGIGDCLVGRAMDEQKRGGVAAEEGSTSERQLDSSNGHGSINPIVLAAAVVSHTEGRNRTEGMTSHPDALRIDQIE